jgi:hypothetical protein
VSGYLINVTNYQVIVGIRKNSCLTILVNLSLVKLNKLLWKIQNIFRKKTCAGSQKGRNTQSRSHIKPQVDCFLRLLFIADVFILRLLPGKAEV